MYQKSVQIPYKIDLNCAVGRHLFGVLYAFNLSYICGTYPSDISIETDYIEIQ